jgi:hypothetical protein
MSFRHDKWIQRLAVQKRIGLKCLKETQLSTYEHAQVHLKQEQLLKADVSGLFVEIRSSTQWENKTFLSMGDLLYSKGGISWGFSVL